MLNSRMASLKCSGKQNRAEQRRTYQNITEECRTEQNRTEQRRTYQNITEECRTEQNIP